MKLEEYFDGASCCDEPLLDYMFDKWNNNKRLTTVLKCQNCGLFHVLNFDEDGNIKENYTTEEV